MTFRCIATRLKWFAQMTFAQMTLAEATRTAETGSRDAPFVKREV